MDLRKAMNHRISVGEVKDLGGGKFSVQLGLEASGNAISQTQTVSADGPDAAVQIAREGFSRWLDKVMALAIRNMPPGMRN